jgi:putative two-component system response regulator
VLKGTLPKADTRKGTARVSRARGVSISSQIRRVSDVRPSPFQPEPTVVMRRERFAGAHILIVDDEKTYVQLLTRFLESIGYRCVRSTTDPFEVSAIVVDFDPDLILLDLRMKGLDGVAVMQQLQPYTNRFYLPILVLTGDISEDAKRTSLSNGARDFLNKPFDLTEVRLRIENLLETRFLHLDLQRQNAQLENRVRERTRELEETRFEILERLSLAADYRDDATGRHTKRVGAISAAIARELSLAEDDVETIRMAAALHDIGKIAIPDAILRKPGPLTPEEKVIIQSHTTIGARMLSGSRSALMQQAETIALGHHEWWNGQGYPNALQGARIPLAARVVALADVVDALASDRPYRAAWDAESIRAEVTRQSGRQFDPAVVDAYFALLERTGAVALIPTPL